MDFLSQFELRHVVDVLLVAYVLYRILILIQGTRAVRVVVGLVLVFVAYTLANLLQLSTVVWLLSNVFTYIVLAVIVLFQSELRRGLAHLGRTAALRGLTTAIPTEPFDDIVSAATAMAAERRGAIIVFERAVGLQNYIDQGITLDAKISFDLLFSIFHPATSLHDGAVIVRGDRAAAASCFLPLTSNPRLSRGLGSRHRAAIGISEETDAVAVVVSEESGSLSLAVSGKITRRLDAASLSRRLRQLLVVEEATGAELEVEEAAESTEHQVGHDAAPQAVHE